MSRQIPPPALSDAPLAPGLYLVATPIGNLRDITLRALDVLAGCDVLLAEDTRVTGKLLSAYGIRTRLERHDEHVAERAIPGILERLEAGERVALVSDAGTPMVSDPGYRLAREAIAAGHPVIPIPGASAALAALTLAGLPTDRFLFAGFPPPKSAARRTFLEEFANVRATLIFYEGASRVADCLADMAAVFGPRPAAVCRELTKLYETCVRGSLTELAADPRFEAPKGEIVILVGPGVERAASANDVEAALREALTRLPLGEATSEVAKVFGLSRKDLYRQALALKEEAAG
ncbi:16S rRNA (cytidine(1402)-2'-O)-methyltransferase [Caulobacter segnis]|uniref:Ribosomal RNA small subunit methyltransferase I n=2 Tax=Caulobacter segnis TaxID=88688 RepID=D5VPK3_CAUST|nr:16S rRNA (cytidine(1402)-2'-O)-methyltransferase [Caulobacter segnis]ADG12426.1 Uroporphyrin-III C/tetrapyrrole (Corrin/Porphyrin) methyltransferase [Caulobacter segnis ATCC 21756]AVQ04013.1 16S rRNA (cytidine(1402)-2'-O)-methyltransferase [Caulobacter segnis]